MQATNEMLSLVLLKSFTSMRKALSNYSDYLKRCSNDRSTESLDPAKLVVLSAEVSELSRQIQMYTDAIVNLKTDKSA